MADGAQLALEITPSLRRLLAHPVLAEEEVHRLVALAQHGDRPARERVVKHHVRFIYGLARKCCFNESLEDLIQEGMIGLLKAIDRFDPKQDVKFTTYATFWVRAALYRSNQSGRLIKDGSRRGKRTRFDFETIGDEMPDSTPLPDELASDKNFSAAVQNRLKLVVDNDRETVILSRLLGDEAKLIDIGAQFGVCRERVRQLETELKRKLRKKLRLLREA